MGERGKATRGEGSATPATDAPAWTKSTLRDYFESICVAVVFALFVRTFVVQAFKIPSSSMEDNLLVGDHILVDKFTYAPHPAWAGTVLPYRDVRHCEVMVFKYPKDPTRDFIKRIIGLPGESIAIEPGRGVVRDGKPLVEPYIVIKSPPEVMKDAPERTREAWAKRYWDHLEWPPTDGGTDHEPMKIGPQSYFAMGDNRLNSEDSRFWGVVPRSLVKGRALLIYWSFDVPPENQQIEVNGPRNAAERGQVLRYTLLHFFDKSRWSRTFQIIRGASLCRD